MNNIQNKLTEFKIAIAPFPFNIVQQTIDSIIAESKILDFFSKKQIGYITVTYNPNLMGAYYTIEQELNGLGAKTSSYDIEEVVSIIDGFFNNHNFNKSTANKLQNEINRIKKENNVGYVSEQQSREIKSKKQSIIEHRLDYMQQQIKDLIQAVDYLYKQQ